MEYKFDCKHFNGYKPCKPYKVCVDCTDSEALGFRILVINLDALGDVLMTTALLPAIKIKYPASTIFWITMPLAVPLLENNPLIDEIIPWTSETMSWVVHMDFDLVLSCDRDRKSTAIAMSVSSLDKRGFGLGPQGVIMTLNPEMGYAYQLGLDDELKFTKNRKTGQQILAEGMGFEYNRHEYVLELTDSEQSHISDFRITHGIGGNIKAIGINTGCSEKFAYKRLKEVKLNSLIQKLLERDTSGQLRILLLGGRSESLLNARLHHHADDSRVVLTPTDEGIRRGLHYIAASDVCISGDSFGLHAAIALKVPTVVFFTISCDVEVDLYDRGKCVLADVPCRPCWKPWCPDPVCIDRIDLDEIVLHTFSFLEQIS
jgi:ADP-heptose:LPS heptosyltransferase